MKFLVSRAVVSGLVGGATAVLATHFVGLYLALNGPAEIGTMCVIGAATFLFTWLFLTRLIYKK
ncbi:hypothetical protein LMG31884_46270 (plasmid) [Xanthomonas hydrangeae]|nr:hypothetical protein LMG31884_46270 [Xanthomonas hydrangeae]CAD7740124.1 hypothetical protein LMG31884_46270 [Xanthomonas hydrangeae]